MKAEKSKKKSKNKSAVRCSQLAVFAGAMCGATLCAARRQYEKSKSWTVRVQKHE
jgi:hypothetical protein